MLKKKLLLVALLAATVTAGLGGPDAQAAKGIRYEGMTKEGTKMSFTLNGTWIDGLSIRMPSTCVSAQGGTPRANVIFWLPPFRFRVGTTAKATDETSITRHYTLKTAGKPGRAITGRMEVNWSEVGLAATTAEMKIWECLSTARFTIRPKR
jgi:hypothetical protein